MKPIILLLLNNQSLRLEIKNQLEENAAVFAAVKLDEVVAEIKWQSIGSILIDMTDNDLDAFGMLGVITAPTRRFPSF